MKKKQLYQRRKSHIVLESNNEMAEARRVLNDEHSN